MKTPIKMTAARFVAEFVKIVNLEHKSRKEILSIVFNRFLMELETNIFVSKVAQDIEVSMVEEAFLEWKLFREELGIDDDETTSFESLLNETKSEKIRKLWALAEV